jgi:hypothetical protein
MKKIMVTIGVASALILIVTACGSTHDVSSVPPATRTIQPPMTGITHTTPTAAIIAQRMHLTHVTVYNATTDENHLLGRQGSYTSKVNWGHDDRSSIEVFPTNADLIKRAQYISAYNGTILGDGYDYSDGTALLRLSMDYTPAQAHTLRTAFIQAVS